MDILSQALRSYIFRRRLAGKACPCGIRIPWSQLRGNKGLPQCFLHAIPIELWRQSRLHDRLPLAAFRTELLAHRAFYGTHLQEVLNLAFSQGQAHVMTVFRLFGEFWNRPGYSHLATYQYYRCMRLEWRHVMDYLRVWKTVHVPHQSYAVPVLQELRSLTSPVIRDELRQPVYAKILRVFAAEQFLVPQRSPWDRPAVLRLCKVYRDGVAKTVTRYQWRQLGFWSVCVRSKIAHWRRAHTFKPLPTFTPNEPLGLLVQRNPRRVPQACEEFLQALATTDVPLMPRDMQAWTNTLKNPAVYAQIVEMYQRTEAWRELADFFRNIPQHDMTPGLLTCILDVFEEAPSYAVYYEAPLRHYLTTDFAVGPKAACAMLSAFHPLCREPPTFHWILHTANVSRYIQDPAVSETLVNLYMNRAMCIRLHQRRRDWVSQAFWETPAVQQMYTGLQEDATVVLGRFMKRVVTTHRQHKTRLADVLERAAPLASTWTFLQIRWRYLRRPVTGECPVCMETHTLLPLHGEKRHGVCRGCMPRVMATQRCPLCRTTLPRTRTFSNASSISYTSDHEQEYYEDPDYDDDEAYHYD